ncbi:MAG: YraN family protein [Chloroflexota bacterium]
MTNARKKLGAWGEKVAITHLQAHGYKILDQNWHCQIGEIDIIAEQGGVISFVEVKTRRGRSAGSPEESITPRKAQKLMQTALTWLGEQEDDDADWQIDLIAVELDAKGKLLRCEHFENFVVG